MGKIKVYELATETEQFILAESDRKFPKETGGMLIGKFAGDCVWIQHATSPGPMAKHSRQRFRRDGNYSQKVLDEIVTESDGKYDYIGEWHSHPVRSRPSGVDVAAMRWIAANSRYAVDTPIMGLCVKGAKDSPWMHFYQFDGTKLRKLKPRSQQRSK